MNTLTVIVLGALVILVVAGITAAAMDLSKLGSRALDLRRARRASRRGWDWPAFERDFASYIARRHGHRPATRRR